MITGHIYTIRFRFWGRATAIFERALGDTLGWRDGSITFGTEEEANAWLAGDEPKQFQRFTYICTEHIDIDALARAMANPERPRAECEDERLVHGFSR